MVTPDAKRGAVAQVAELHPARLGHCQRLLGAPRDGFAFGLGHQRHDADGEVIGLRHIDGEEMHAAVAQRQQERGVPAQAVELGDDQGGAGQAGQLDGFDPFGPVGVAAAFDLGEAGQDLGSL